MQKPRGDVLPDFRIFETDEFLKKLNKLSSKDASFLRRKLDSYVYPQLREEPFWRNNIKKLQGYDPDTWRYRIGRFRLFFIVDLKENIIYILSIDNRKDVYK
jgi:mRNA interferase RelE/StbE